MTEQNDQECDWCRDCNQPWGQGDCPSCRFVGDYHRSQENPDDVVIVPPRQPLSRDRQLGYWHLACKLMK